MTTPYNDNQAGLFDPIVDHRTGRTLYGAAAREYRLLVNNGITGYQAAALYQFEKYIEPLLMQMQQNQQQQQQMLEVQQRLILQQQQQIFTLMQQRGNP